MVYNRFVTKFFSNHHYLWILSAIYLAYLVFRVWQVPLVFDEATTYFLYVQTGEVWPGMGYWSANNHYLNSALAWLCTQFLGATPFALRLPNLLAFLVYSFVVMTFVRRMPTGFLKIACFFSLLGPHYALEFFAYSRGYGIAMAFWLLAWWQLFRYFESHKTVFAAGFCGAVGLVVSANLSVLPGLGLLVLLAITLVFNRNRLYLWWFAPLSLAPLAIGAALTNKLAAQGELFYGGTNGLLGTTLPSKQRAFFDTVTWPIAYIFPMLLVCFGLAAAFLMRSKGTKQLYNPAFWPAWVLLGCLVFYTLAHHTMGILYPLDRAVLYLVCCLILGIFIMAAELHKAQPKLAIALVVPFLVVPVLGAIQSQPAASVSYNWRVEQMPHFFYETVAAHPGKTIGGGYLLEPQWNFLQQQNNCAIPVFAVATESDTLLDFKVVPINTVATYAAWYTVAATHAQTLALLQRKRVFHKVLLLDSLLPVATKPNDYGIYSASWPPPVPLDLLEIELQLEVPKQVFTPVLVVMALDTAGVIVSYRDYKLGRNFAQGEVLQQVFVVADLTNLPPTTQTLHVFVYNYKGLIYTVSHASLRGFQVR